MGIRRSSTTSVNSIGSSASSVCSFLIIIKYFESKYEMRVIAERSIGPFVYDQIVLGRRDSETENDCVSGGERGREEEEREGSIADTVAISLIHRSLHCVKWEKTSLINLWERATNQLPSIQIEN